MKKIYWIVTFLIVAGCSVSKVNKEKSLAPDHAELIDYLFRECVGERPGANILVIKKGKIIHQKSYGLANVEEKIKATPETNYRIASVTKQFTAMAIMILVHQEKLSYETKLTAIFPDFPSYGDDISVRHIVTHQSGLIDYNGFFADDRTEQMLDAEVLDSLITSDSTYFTPGSKYQYSNTGYAVLAQIIEKVSNQSFADFLDKEIFQKLEMTNSTVFELDESIANRAFGYIEKEDSIIFNDQSLTSAIQGDGGIYSSTLDYYKWDQALYTDKLVPQTLLEDAFYNWDNHTRTDKEGCGYGWFIDFRNGIKILNHSGGTAGFEHQVLRIPELELTVVLFTNRVWTGRFVWYNANALASIFSDYKVQMPIEIIVRKEIEQNGIERGIYTYDKLKNDARYETKLTTLSHLGFAFLRINRLEEAKAIFFKAQSANPNYFGGYFGAGMLFKKTGETGKAIEYFEKAIKIGAEDEPRSIARAKKELKKLKESTNGQ